MQRELEAVRAQIDVAKDEQTAKSTLLIAAKSQHEELLSQNAATAAEIEELQSSAQTFADETEAAALSRAKTVLSGVYASLGEQFADGTETDGGDVRKAIKAAILTALKNAA